MNIFNKYNRIPITIQVKKKQVRKDLKGLTAVMLMCMCFLTVSVKAQYVSSVSTDKTSYPQGETVIATASVSSSVYYIVFYLKDNTVSGSAYLDKSGNIYIQPDPEVGYNTTLPPKAAFSTSARTAGTYYVYAVAYNSSGTVIDNTHFATITVTNAEYHYSNTPSTSTATVNFTKVSGRYIFINAPESLSKSYLGDHASGYGNKIIYRGNISGKTRVYAEFNNDTGENIYYGYCFWNGSNQPVTIDILSQGVSYGWNARSTDTWQTWFSTGPFRLGGNSYSIAPNSAAWLFVGNPYFVYNSSAPNQFTSSALSIESTTFDCALEILPSATVQIEAIAFHNFANMDGTYSPITNLADPPSGVGGTGVSDYNAVNGNLSWTIGNDVANGSVLPVQGGTALGNGIWQSHDSNNPEALQIQLVNGHLSKICNWGVIYTETLSFTNNSNSDKLLEYYIQVPQTWQNGNEVRRAVGINLPNDQQFFAYNFLGPRTDGQYTYGWDSYGGDYKNVQSNQPVSRFVKKITVPRNSTTSTIVEYVLGGQSSENIQHFVKVVASSNYKYDIVTSSSPSAGGTTSGGGTYAYGSRTITATANTGYIFSNWTENGSVVSTSANYTFTPTTNRNLVANFKQNTITPPTVTTQAATNIMQTTATLNKTVTAGTETITSQGFQYRVSGASSWNTTTNNNLTGLTANTTYQFQAYATTASSTTYGSILTFTTLANVPANDLCANATNLSCDALTNGILAGATPSTNYGDYTTFPDVFYQFTAANSGNHTITFTKTNLLDDIDVIVYQGCGSTTQLASISDNNITETRTFNCIAGTNYRIRVVACGTISGTFSIKVDCPPTPTLTVSATSYNFAASGGTSSAITVTSNQSWNISDDASWLTTSLTSGSNNGSFTMTATANTSTSSRSATVTVLGGGLTKTIGVTQAGTTTLEASLQLQALAANGTLYQNQTGSFTATLKNNGNVTYNSHLWIYLEKTLVYTPNQSIDGGVISIAAGETKTVTISGTINLPPDVYACNMMQDINNNPSNMAKQQFDGTVLGVQVTVKAATYTLTFDAQGGTVSPSNQTVTYGTAVGTLPTPTRSGYNFGGWFTQTNSNGTQYYATTVYNTAGNTTIYAYWSPIPITTYTITASAGSNGTISPNGNISVNQGNSQTFNFYPNNGYEINQVSVDGSTNATAKANGYYTFSNVTASHTISVSFQQTNTWQIGSPIAANVIATLNNGTLTITGTGAMQGWNNTSMPWYNVKNEITSVVINYGVTTIGTCAFEAHTNLSSVSIPSSITSTGSWAFVGCTKLTSITLPASITSIDQESFRDCNNLAEIHCENSTPPSVGYESFDGVNKTTCTLFVPFGTVNAYKAAYEWKDFFGIYTAIDPVKASNFNIYPNPVKNELIIERDNLNAENKKIQIIDFSGRIVIISQFSPLNTQIKIKVSYLSAGTYIVKIGNYRNKFIKQ